MVPPFKQRYKTQHGTLKTLVRTKHLSCMHIIMTIVSVVIHHVGNRDKLALICVV